MENKVGYIVEIHSGQIGSKGMTNETQRFDEGELLKARSQAIEFASSTLVDLEMESSDEDFAFSVDVFFQFNDELLQIFGADREEVIPGLIEEAKILLKKGLISKNELTTIFQNNKSHEEDPGNPQFVFSKGDLKNWPSMESSEHFIIAQNLELIFIDDF